MHKLLKGSFIILIGTIIFRIGGYLFVVLTQSLLGIQGYGMLSLVMSFQWILILIAVAGLPPAIAKYVSEYLAKDDKFMVKQVIKTSFKIMLAMSLIFTTVFYLLATPLANFFHGGPEVAILFQAVSFIAPFSVILGLFRGVFQGYQRMTDIMVTRAVEQIFMISMAVVFILAGFYVLGAVIGTLIGFGIASLSAFLIFKFYLWDGLKDVKKPIIPVNESQLAKKLLIFSSPIIITGLAELTLFQTGNFIIPYFMNFTALGYYNIASPIARLPLIISSSVAVALLPAASEALALNSGNLVKKYVIHSYRYLLIVLLPLCAIVIILGLPIMNLLFPKAPLAYSFAGTALSILVIGMAFFSVYGISASVLQAAGKPYPAMFFLAIGTASNLILTVILVPMFGLNGAAIATMLASLMVMVLTTSKTIEVTNTKLPYLNLLKITFSSFIIGLCLLLVPKTIPGLLISLILVPVIYILLLGFTQALERRDLLILNKLGYRLGPLSNPIMRFTGFLERFIKEND
ncbi:MAG: flippase [Methanobacterium sp.]